MSTVSLTLPSDLLSPIVANTPLSLSEFSTLCLLAKGSKKRILPVVSELILTQPTKLTHLLTLCGDYPSLPRLSGLLLVDLPSETVPWTTMKYRHLTIYLECKLPSEPRYFTSFFELAIKDPLCSLSLYGNDNLFMAQAIEGYVTRTLYFASEAGIGAHPWEKDLKPKKILARSPVDKNGGMYQGLWLLRELFEFGQYEVHASKFPELRTIRSDRPWYIMTPTLLTFTKMVTLGPNVIVVNESTCEKLNHPTLTNLNVSVLVRGDEEWALKQGLPVTLYAPRELIPLFQHKYKGDQRVVGVMPLE